MVSFQNRFSYPNNDGISSGIDFDTSQSFSDTDIEAISPELFKFANLVKGYSVIISRKSLVEIFNVCTQQADPRIGLILSAAKKRTDNTPLFSGLGEVWSVMFDSTPTRTPTGTGTPNNLYFSDGIRRVSAALTASILIGQLAQLTEQFEHSKHLEAQALDDLDRICATWELTVAQTAALTESEKPDFSIALYFEKLLFTIDPASQLSVSWYSPAFSTAWQFVKTYTGQLSTWMIVSDLADAMNFAMAQSSGLALVSIANSSGPNIPVPLHTLSFYPRSIQAGVVAHSINIRIETKPLGSTSPPSANSVSPFKWGPLQSTISNLPVNGAILITDYAKLTSSSVQAQQSANDYEPIVLYIRNKLTYTAGTNPVPPDTSKIIIRSQPWQPGLSAQDSKPSETEIIVPRIITTDQVTSDNFRFSQVALLILNSLADFNLLTKATGAIIRNDPLSSPQPLAGLELVAWGITNVNAAVLLDVLEVPPDIEIATGDRTGPSTLFSSNPRTIRVKCTWIKSTITSSLSANLTLQADSPKLVHKPKSLRWAGIQDEAKTLEPFPYI